jgi:hypothetical protein
MLPPGSACSSLTPRTHFYCQHTEQGEYLFQGQTKHLYLSVTRARIFSFHLDWCHVTCSHHRLC